MGHGVYLEDDDGSTVEVSGHRLGSNVPVSGDTQKAEATITYNYSWFFCHLIDEDRGLAWLDGKKARETVDRLENAIDQLPDNPTPHECGESPRCGYWCPTPSNAAVALETLASWARQHPQATWRVV